MIVNVFVFVGDQHDDVKQDVERREYDHGQEGINHGRIQLRVSCHPHP
jgi:hypothetical protein